jgi:hypothetical protein
VWEVVIDDELQQRFVKGMLVNCLAEHISPAFIGLGFILLCLALENLLQFGLSPPDNLGLLAVNLNPMPVSKVASCRG